MSVHCKHNAKARKDGLCKDCSEQKAYTVFRFCNQENCNHNCGYFWGPGAPEDKIGKPMYKEGNPPNE